jgi:hypothetical protein
MSRYLWLGITAIALSGCMETAGPTFNGPSGTPVNTAKCMYSSASCMQQASGTCHGPYQVLDSDSHSGGLVADLMPGPVTWYALTYQCGPSDGKMPAFAFRGQQFVDSPVQPIQPVGNAGDPPRLQNAIPPTVRCHTYGNQTTCQ